MKYTVQMLRFHVFLTGQHLICVALNGVDLAIVHNKAVGVGSLPAGICVGRETGMHDGNGRLIILILQIRKKGAKLPYQKHSFIYDRPAR